jgi:hypothetical protein
MKRSWIVTAAFAVVAAVFAVWLLRPGGGGTAIDLVGEFPNATIKKPNAEAFSIIDASIAGVSHHAIFTSEPSRIAWQVTVPDNAWLKLSLGLKEQAWTMQGDGVLFQIGVSNHKTYEELLRLNVNPFGEPADRQWKDLTLDLSPYSGQNVDLIFNTYSSLPPQPGQPPKDDRNGDLALWGDPRIVVR